MAFNKSHLFDPADQLVSGFARALSHPVRLDILRILASKGPCSVENLSLRYPLSKSTVSQHLELLRKYNLIRYHEEFPFIIYSLDDDAFGKLNSRLQEYFMTIR